MQTADCAKGGGSRRGKRQHHLHAQSNPMDLRLSAGGHSTENIHAKPDRLLSVQSSAGVSCFATIHSPNHHQASHAAFHNKSNSISMRGLGLSGNQKRSMISSDHVRRLLGAGCARKRGSLGFLETVDAEEPSVSILDNLKSTIFLEKSNFVLETDNI